MRLRIFSENIPAFVALGLFCLILDLFLLLRHRRKREEGTLELVSRILGSNFFALYIGYRILLRIEGPRFFTWWSWVNWVLIIIPFFIFFLSYLIRSAPLAAASRFREIVFPFFCALLPFGVYESVGLLHLDLFRSSEIARAILTPWHTFSFHPWRTAAFSFVFVGDLVSVVGLLYLRRSFSIMMEARSLVTHGPYRWVRHPVYLGEAFSMIGFCLLLFSPLNLFLTLVFLVGQTLRGYWEEAKLIGSFPQYGEYRKRAGFYFPRILKSS